MLPPVERRWPRIAIGRTHLTYGPAAEPPRPKPGVGAKDRNVTRLPTSALLLGSFPSWLLGMHLLVPDAVTDLHAEAFAAMLARPLPLDIRLTCLADTLVGAGSPSFRAVIANSGNQEITLPVCLEEWGTFRVVDPTGLPVRLGVAIPGQASSTTGTQTLAPGEAITELLERTILLDHPGDWTVSWVLRVPKGSERVAMKPGIAASNTTVITVE